MAGLPVAVEFRNRNWFQAVRLNFIPSWFGLYGSGCTSFKRVGTALAHATTDFAYVRFHGRNTEKWFQHTQSYERYDYTYQKRAGEWVPSLKALEEATGTVYVTFNNHYQGQAVAAARDLAELGQKRPRGSNKRGRVR